LIVCSFMGFVTSVSAGIYVRSLLIESFQMMLVGSCLPLFRYSVWVSSSRV
jgi:hypothetical protein